MKTALTAHTRFAQRSLRITIANPKRLDAGCYTVSQVLAGTTALPLSARPEGGVRIARRTIERLPQNLPARVRVILAPLR